MQVLKPSVALSRVPEALKVATAETEFREIWQLREAEYSKHYPGVTYFRDDVYDGCACVLYSQNNAGKLISTGRVAFDGPFGLPADEIIKPEVDKLRRQGLVIAEVSKFAIAREARGILPTYLRAYCEIAVAYGIDSLIFIIRDKNVSLYEKLVNAKVLLADVGHSYGTSHTFSFLAMNVKANKVNLSNGLREDLQ